MSMSRPLSLFFATLVLVSATPAHAEEVTLPRGTMIDVRIETDLHSDQAREGEPFQAVVLETVYADGRTVIPAGSTVDGVVSLVKSGGTGHRSGVLGLRFVRLRSLNGHKYAIDGTFLGFRPARDGSIVPAKPPVKRAVVVIGNEAEGPGKRPSSLVGNAGEDEETLAERWAQSGLGPNLAEIDAGSEVTFQLRKPLVVQPSAAD
jgi:hypothetical protein